MAIEVTMPALSPSMEKGTLARWLVAVGDRVEPGDLIAEIETDKATMEVEATEAGFVTGLIVAAGTDDVPVGGVIALLSEHVEADTAQVASMQPPPSDKLAPAPVESDPDRDVSATPLARRIAAAMGISLDAIAGTGSRGRVVKADLGLTPPIARPETTVVAAPTSPATVAPPPAGVPVETVKLSTMRKTIARRLSESKQTVPHFYLTVRCNLDPLQRLRGDLNATMAARGVRLSVNDLLIKAMASALQCVPDANVQFGGDTLHRFARVDISMAVAIAGGLVTPVIRDVGALSLSAIAQASKLLAARARDGRLTPEDYAGGTASLSNLGMFGIDEMFPVINPPQALILGIGAGITQPWQVEGQIGLAPIMAATASFDHRAIDGATAAQFVAAFREHVENPMLLCG